MTKKRSRGLRKCAHYRSQKCPYTHLVEAGKFKCDICTKKDGDTSRGISPSSGGNGPTHGPG